MPQTKEGGGSECTVDWEGGEKFNERCKLWIKPILENLDTWLRSVVKKKIIAQTFLEQNFWARNKLPLYELDPNMCLPFHTGIEK